MYAMTYGKDGMGPTGPKKYRRSRIHSRSEPHGLRLTFYEGVVQARLLISWTTNVGEPASQVALLLDVKNRFQKALDLGNRTSYLVSSVAR